MDQPRSSWLLSCVPLILNVLVLVCICTSESTSARQADMRTGLSVAEEDTPSSSHPYSFSYCLPDMFSSTPSTLTFGLPPTNDELFRFTPLLRSPLFPTFHYLSLNAISIVNPITLNHTFLPVPPSSFQIDSTTGKGGVILDSGTSITRLAPHIYALLRDAYRAEISSSTPEFHLSDAPFAGFDTCFDLDRPAPGHGSAVATIPTIVLHFQGNGTDLYLPPGNILVPIQFLEHVPSRQFCLAFAPMVPVEQQPFSVIIGNIQQQGFRFLLNSHTSQLGFAPFQC